MFGAISVWQGAGHQLDAEKRKHFGKLPMEDG